MDKTLPNVSSTFVSLRKNKHVLTDTSAHIVSTGKGDPGVLYIKCLQLLRDILSRFGK